MNEIREWYYALGSDRQGPVTREELDALAASGAVTFDTPVWHPSYTEWRPYGGGAGQGGAPGRVKCSISGEAADPEDAVSLFGGVVSARWKEYYLEHLREGIPLPGERRYAHFGPRAAAKLLDWALIGAVNLALSLLLWYFAATEPSAGIFLSLTVAATAIQWVCAIAYNTYFVGAFGATPGKMAMGLHIIAPGHAKVSYLRAFGRYWGEVLSGMVLYLGYVMPLFDDENRGLHDHLCGTRVLTDEEPAL